MCDNTHERFIIELSKLEVSLGQRSDGGSMFIHPRLEETGHIQGDTHYETNTGPEGDRRKCIYTALCRVRLNVTS